MQLGGRLETRVRQLMLQYEKLQRELADANDTIRQERERIQILEDEKQELQDRYMHLKMAKLIDMADDGDMRQVKQRINKMIHSVDRCISILKIES